MPKKRKVVKKRVVKRKTTSKKKSMVKIILNSKGRPTWKFRNSKGAIYNNPTIYNTPSGKKLVRKNNKVKNMVKRKVVKKRVTKKRVVKRKAPVKRKTATRKRKPVVLKRSRYQTGKTHVKPDRKLPALAPGKRRSEAGNIYYERRRNRSDMNKRKRI